MELLFGKSKWEMWDAPLGDFLQRAAADRFEAVEIFVPSLREKPHEIRNRIADHGLRFVAQIVTEGATPAEHLESLKERFDRALATEPLMINCHTGRDHFGFADNVRLFEQALHLAGAAGVLFTHETHRGRALFAAHVTRRYLEVLPALRINADFSHWFCVHESDLSDQPESVAAAVDRTSYIHARVGFEEGPQVPDPAAPEWQSTVEKFTALWHRIIAARRRDSAPFLVITPEFGPPLYMPCEPFTRRPLADAWTVNTAFRDTLRSGLPL